MKSVEFRWVKIVKIEEGGIPMRDGNRYIWCVLEYRERENVEEPFAPVVWSPWREVEKHG